MTINLIRRYIISWDFVIAACLCGIAARIFSSDISNPLIKDLYGVGISVLSIVFSVYFAALAIIISSSDDEFVRFLEEMGDYTRLIKTFKFALIILFMSLIYAIIMYTLTSALINDQEVVQPKWAFVFFCFLFPYSLFVVASTTLDAIRYAKTRSDFLNEVRKKHK